MRLNLYLSTKQFESIIMYMSKKKDKQLHQKGTSEFLRLDSSQLISLLNSNFPINMSESEVKRAMMETWRKIYFRF